MPLLWCGSPRPQLGRVNLLQWRADISRWQQDMALCYFAFVSHTHQITKKCGMMRHHSNRTLPAKSTYCTCMATKETLKKRTKITYPSTRGTVVSFSFGRPVSLQFSWSATWASHLGCLKPFESKTEQTIVMEVLEDAWNMVRMSRSSG